MPFVTIGPGAIEYARIEVGGASAPTFVMLHEGLGSLSMWKDFPARLAEATRSDDVDGTFRGWNDIWLDPASRSWNIEEYLPRIGVPDPRDSRRERRVRQPGPDRPHRALGAARRHAEARRLPPFTASG